MPAAGRVGRAEVVAHGPGRCAFPPRPRRRRPHVRPESLGVRSAEPAHSAKAPLVEGRRSAAAQGVLAFFVASATSSSASVGANASLSLAARPAGRVAGPARRRSRSASAHRARNPEARPRGLLPALCERRRARRRRWSCRTAPASGPPPRRQSQQRGVVVEVRGGGCRRFGERPRRVRRVPSGQAGRRGSAQPKRRGDYPRVRL